MNVHDSEKMYGILRQNGYEMTQSARSADLVILNTCSIREKAEQKCYSELGRLKIIKRKKPRMLIAVAGCIAQREGMNIFQRAGHVDFIFGPQNISVLRNIHEKTFPFAALDEDTNMELHEFPVERCDRVKAWISITYGCDNYCSYCVVPFTRGRERSRPSDHIVREVRDLAERGFLEITLLGQNVNSYRSDVDFPGLLTKLNAIDGIQRIRFVTSHPKDLSHRLIKAISDLPKVCEHIHLPLQSASDSILRRMNRGYTFSDYMNVVETLRKTVPTIAITTDIIAGFPGETDHDHCRTLSALRDICFDGVFAFAFSPRPGTLAATFEDQVPHPVKYDRLSDILSLQDEITLARNRDLVGSVQEVLIEETVEKNDAKYIGRTRTNKIVSLSANSFFPGTVLSVEIVKARKHSLEGVPLRT